MSNHLRDADDLMAPALAQTVAALNPPDSDAALVRLAEVVAATIDGMAAGQRGMMLGQTAPLLLKVLQELEDRAGKRRAAAARSGRSNKVAQMRSAHMASAAKRGRAS